MKLYLLTGPVGSGKSTFCKLKDYDNAIIINDDSIVNALHGNVHTRYNKQLKPLYKGVEQSILSLALNNEYVNSILIDRPLHKRKTRQRYINFVNNVDNTLRDVEIIGLIFPREHFLIHAKRRMCSDSRGHSLDYWEKVVRVHEELYEPPLYHEGFDHIYDVTFSPPDSFTLRRRDES